MKLPDHAKKVFSGFIFDTYQWDQEMFDGTTEVFEMLKRSDTVQVIATQGDKILYTKESQPTAKNFLSLPGGRVDAGETPENAAKRELREETGFSSTDWTLWKSFEPIHKIDWTIYYYIAKNCELISEQTLDAGEKIEVCRATFDEFIDTVLHEQFWSRELVEHVLRMKVNGTLEEFKKTIFS